MNEEELKHYLKTLVELDLYFKIKVIDEGTEIKNPNIAKKELIKAFLNNLPPQYRLIEGYEEIVLETLKKLMQKSKKREDER